MSSPPPLIEMVAIAEFDILKGNTISVRWPQTASLEVLDDELLACLCLPDGAHIHDKDSTRFLIHPAAEPGAGARAGAEAGASVPGRIASRLPLYATAAFANVADASVDRGAIQQSMVAVAHVPYFAQLGEILAHAVGVAVDVMRGALESVPVEVDTRQDVVRSVYEVLNAALHRELEVVVLGKTFRLHRAIQGGPKLLRGAPKVQRTASGVASSAQAEDALMKLIDAAAAAGQGGDASAASAELAAELVEWPITSYTGVNLSSLIRTFGQDSMILWYALLMGHRVLFTGQPAAGVCNMVLAAALMTAPIEIPSARLAPFVCLQDVAPLAVPGAVCGSTTLLFATREEWFDLHGSLTTGTIVASSAPGAPPKIRLGSADRKFIKNVMAGLSDSRSETWVRTQFTNYTRAFLASVDADTLKGAQAKYLSSFVNTSTYAAALVAEARRQAESDAAAAAATDSGSGGPASALSVPHVSVADLRAGISTLLANGSTMSLVQLQHALFELDSALSDVEHLEEVTRVGGVRAVLPFLDSSSAQVRKYAVSVLGKLACSHHGQVAILQMDAIQPILALLRDPRANVAAAAATCVLHISRLFIGAHALVRAGARDLALDLVCDSETPLTVKMGAAKVLSQIFTLVASLPVPDDAVVNRVHLQLYTESPDYKADLFQLLDGWGASLPSLPWTDTVERFLNALCVEDQLTRTDASCHILSVLTANPDLVLEFVARGGVEVVLQNLKPVVNMEILVTASFCLLTRLATTFLGRRRMLHLLIVPKAVTALAAINPALAFVAAEFLETLTQFEETGELVLADSGIPALHMTASRALNDPHVRALALPSLSALRNAVFFVPGAADTIAAVLADKPLTVGKPSSDPEMDDHTAELLSSLHIVLDHRSSSVDADDAAAAGDAATRPTAVQDVIRGILVHASQLEI